MQQITEIIANGAISILVILAGVTVKAVKDYLVQNSIWWRFHRYFYANKRRYSYRYRS